ncbi:MAG: Ig-like domain-containing protein [Flavisolibacter sp.]
MDLTSNHIQKSFWQLFTTLGNRKLLGTLLLLSFFSLNLPAQIIIDGHTSDWSGATYNAYSHDANNTNDNQFTQGSKDGNAISSWAWSNGQTNNKGDITNGAAILGVETIGGQPHNILYFAGDRAVNNGDAAIGFWFFKGTVALDTLSGTSVSNYAGAFTGAHQDGDILVVSHFTQGGGQADIFIYKWQGTGLLAPVTSSTAAVNSALENVPTGFTYASTQYPIGDFFEGKIDLTSLSIPPCFSNFLLETRNSQSITASLQDLTFGSFTQSVPPPGTTGAARCGTGSLTLSASGCTGGTLKWFTAQTGGTQVNTGTSFTTTLSATTTYWVSCTTADGCISARTSVTGTINPNPTVTASATPAGPVPIASTPPHYSLSTTVNTVLNNTGFTYSWVQDPPTGGSLSNSAIPNPTFRATAAGTFTWTVTATDKVTGCFNSASVTRDIGAAAGCPVISNLTVCAGGTGTITATTGEANNAIPANTHYDWSIVSPANGATITSAVTHDVTSINVQAGTANFTVKVRVSYDNTNITPIETCTKLVTVNPNAAPPDVTYIGPSCTETTFKVQVNNPEVGSTYKLTQLDGNVVTIGPYASGSLIFTGLHQGQGYSIVATTAAGCKSNPNQCGSFTTSTVVRAPTLQVEQGTQATVIAAPNPFNDKIRFTVKAPLGGQGSLELYNMLGQKVKTVFQGRIEKGAIQTFEYNVPGAQRANLIYLFRIGNQKITGKLIGLK